MTMKVGDPRELTDSFASRELSYLTLRLADPRISGRRPKTGNNDGSTLPSDYTRQELMTSYNSDDNDTAATEAVCARPFPVLAVTRNPSFYRLSGGRDNGRQNKENPESKNSNRGFAYVVVNSSAGDEELAVENDSETIEEKVGYWLKHRGVSLEQRGLKELDETMPPSQKTQRNKNKDLPTWPPHPLELEDADMIAGSGGKTVQPRVVSDGFWKSIKLTPGELALDRTRPRLGEGSGKVVRRLGLPIQKQGVWSREVNAAAESEPTQSILSSYGSNGGSDYKNRVSMVQIVDVLSYDGQSARRLKSQASNRINILDKCGDAFKLSTVEMALKTARRYRHPNRPLANMPMTSKHPMESKQQENRSGEGSMGQTRSRAITTPLEQAMRTRSSTYSFQQRAKGNRHASRSSLYAFRPSTDLSGKTKIGYTSSPTRVGLLSVRKKDRRASSSSRGTTDQNGSSSTNQEHQKTPLKDHDSQTENVCLPPLSSATPALSFKVEAGDQNETQCKTPFNSPVASSSQFETPETESKSTTES